MKKAPKRRKPPETALERYDWSKAQHGRYAGRFARTAHAVVIEPDLYAHFGNAERINEALSLLVRMEQLIAAETPARKRKRKAA